MSYSVIDRIEIGRYYKMQFKRVPYSSNWLFLFYAEVQFKMINRNKEWDVVDVTF